MKTTTVIATALLLFLGMGSALAADAGGRIENRLDRRGDRIDQHLVAELALLTAEDPLDFFEEIDSYEWLSTVDGEENDLAWAHDDRPVSGSFSSGLFPIPARTGRGTGCGDAGIPRII